VFVSQLRGGYINGLYLSALERRRITEKEDTFGPFGSTQSLNALNLSPEERMRLPSFFHARARFLAPYRGPSFAGNKANSVHPPPMFYPHQQMQWALPSPMANLSDQQRFGGKTPKSAVKPSDPLLRESLVRPSPLSSSRHRDFSVPQMETRKLNL
jgi:hypothetical protein